MSRFFYPFSYDFVDAISDDDSWDEAPPNCKPSRYVGEGNYRDARCHSVHQDFHRSGTQYTPPFASSLYQFGLAHAQSRGPEVVTYLLGQMALSDTPVSIGDTHLSGPPPLPPIGTPVIVATTNESRTSSKRPSSIKKLFKSVKNTGEGFRSIPGKFIIKRIPKRKPTSMKTTKAETTETTVEPIAPAITTTTTSPTASSTTLVDGSIPNLVTAEQVSSPSPETFAVPPPPISKPVPEVTPREGSGSGTSSHLASSAVPQTPSSRRVGSDVDTMAKPQAEGLKEVRPAAADQIDIINLNAEGLQAEMDIVKPILPSMAGPQTLFEAEGALVAPDLVSQPTQLQMEDNVSGAIPSPIPEVTASSGETTLISPDINMEAVENQTRQDLKDEFMNDLVLDLNGAMELEARHDMVDSAMEITASKDSCDRMDGLSAPPNSRDSAASTIGAMISPITRQSLIESDPIEIEAKEQQIATPTDGNVRSGMELDFECQTDRAVAKQQGVTQGEGVRQPLPLESATPIFEMATASSPTPPAYQSSMEHTTTTELFQQPSVTVEMEHEGYFSVMSAMNPTQVVTPPTPSVELSASTIPSDQDCSSTSTNLARTQTDLQDPSTESTPIATAPDRSSSLIRPPSSPPRHVSAIIPQSALHSRPPSQSVSGPAPKPHRGLRDTLALLKSKNASLTTHPDSTAAVSTQLPQPQHPSVVLQESESPTFATPLPPSLPRPVAGRQSPTPPVSSSTTPVERGRQGPATLKGSAIPSRRVTSGVLKGIGKNSEDDDTDPDTLAWLADKLDSKPRRAPLLPAAMPKPGKPGAEDKVESKKRGDLAITNSFIDELKAGLRKQMQPTPAPFNVGAPPPFQHYGIPYNSPAPVGNQDYFCFAPNTPHSMPAPYGHAGPLHWSPNSSYSAPGPYQLLNPFQWPTDAPFAAPSPFGPAGPSQFPPDAPKTSSTPSFVADPSQWPVNTSFTMYTPSEDQSYWVRFVPWTEPGADPLPPYDQNPAATRRQLPSHSVSSVTVTPIAEQQLCVAPSQVEFVPRRSAAPMEAHPHPPHSLIAGPYTMPIQSDEQASSRQNVAFSTPAFFHPQQSQQPAATGWQQPPSSSPASTPVEQQPCVAPSQVGRVSAGSVTPSAASLTEASRSASIAGEGSGGENDRGRRVIKGSRRVRT